MKKIRPSLPIRTRYVKKYHDEQLDLYRFLMQFSFINVYYMMSRTMRRRMWNDRTKN